RIFLCSKAEKISSATIIRGIGESGGGGDGGMGGGGDGEMGRWGDGEMGRWGDGAQIKYFFRPSGSGFDRDLGKGTIYSK
ncbi:hypothetical protein, partial [Okeania sp. SIO2C9]|uniref:hypothetical protein n=1 Tax=Okeania sp. SIO2C9 TaxID=2607791 RepID=UPI0025E9BC63